MKCKYYLILGSDKVNTSSADCMDVSEMITNLDDIKMSYNRADLGGIIRKISSEIQVCGDARDSIVDYYTANMLHSKGAFGVYRIKNDWSYEPLFECPLDFTTFSYDNNIAKIGCIDNSISAVIKANRNVKYEIPVKDIKDSHVLNFDGIRLGNTAAIYAGGESVEGQTYTTLRKNCTGYVYFIPPMYYSDEEVVYNRKIAFSDQQEALGAKIHEHSYELNKQIDSYFLTCLERCSITFDLNDFTIKRELISPTGSADFHIELGLISDGSDHVDVTYSLSGTDKTRTIDLDVGEKLQLSLRGNFIGSMYESLNDSIFTFDGKLNITWNDVADPVDIDVIKPTALLSRIITEMGINDASMEFEANALLEHTLIVASESIRNFNAAKLYTSFSDFCSYMEAVYGFIHQVQDNKIKFIHRSSVFKNNLVKTLNVISEPTYKVASDRIYSDIEIGYTKQDYDLGNNGNDEFNSTNYYSTGLNLKSRKLKLVSPYRADSYGFQEMAGKRVNEQSQDKSDSNIFIVHVSNPDTTGKYTLDRSLNVTGTYTDTIFNAAFSPLAMVQNNLGYLSSFCDAMTFTASDGNTDAVIGDIPMNGDITMTEPLFRAGELTIKTNDMILPREWNGYISFKWGEKTFNCYLKGMDISIIQNEVLEYEVLDYELIER